MQNLAAQTVFPQGSIVTYEKPFPDEDPNSRFIILEADADRPLVMFLHPTWSPGLAPTYRHPASAWKLADLTDEARTALEKQTGRKVVA